MYNDADIEMAHLNAGLFDDEPPCPTCGAHDTFVSRFSRDDAANAVLAEISAAHGGITVTVCTECRGVFDNRAGKGFAHLGQC
jgi:hypothetical protein